MTHNNVQPRKSKKQPFLLIMVIILILSLLFESFAFAEKEYTFKNGKFKSDHFSINIPDAISVIFQETDNAIGLTTENEDIYLYVILEEAPGLSLDLLDENLNTTDKTYVASIFTSSDLNLITSTLKQTARINRNDDIEILEYRFDAIINNQPWIAFHTCVHKKGTDDFCEIKLLANNKKARTAILHYITLIDSIIAKTSTDLGKDEWLCNTCGAVNSDNYCSICGSKKPSPTYNSETKASPAEAQPINQPETTFNNSSAPQKESSASYDNIVSIAKGLAGLIAYNAEAPTSKNCVTVKIEGKTVLVHVEFKYAMDVFYEFYKEYFDSIKKYDIGKMTSLALKAEEVDAALEAIDNMELSDGDMAYYMSIYAKILQIIGDIGNSQ